MKRTGGKILSILLAAVMVLSLAPFGVLSDLAKTALPVAAAKSYSVGDIITFGGYPQTRLTDAATIAALDAKVTAGDWKSYGYYSGNGDYGSMVPGDWMEYCDIKLNGGKYRGVRFSQYRPGQTGDPNTGATEQADNGYYPNNIYWFRWESLRWRVLDQSKGLVLCEKIIDSQAYSNTIYWKSNSYTNDAAGEHYANDYATSSIRNWLINDFYNNAFSSAEQALIGNTVPDNSAFSTSYSQYNSASTTDKIFLLSYNDMLNAAYGFSSSDRACDTRRAQGTDYAKCQGLWVLNSSSVFGNSYWWLCSPGPNSSHAANVGGDGDVISFGFVNYTGEGVRPAFQFKSGISESSNPAGGSGSGVGRSTGNGAAVQNNTYLTLTARNLEQWANWSYGNEIMKDPNEDYSDNPFLNYLGEDHPLKWALKDANAFVGSREYPADDKGLITVKKSEITNDVIVSRADYYDYIIPQDVARSLDNGKLNAAYLLEVYMQKDKKNGKPYLSTVFAKQNAPGENYIELKTEKMTLYTGLQYSFYFTAGNLNEPATYYLAQDDAHRFSSNTGVFTFDNSALNLVKGKTVWAYAVTASGVVTDPVELKLTVYEGGGTEDVVKQVVGDGSISLGGGDGLAITCPADWALIGGASISLCDFKAPIGVEVTGDSVKVSVGFDFFSKETTDNTSKAKVRYPDGSVADKTHYVEHDTKAGWSAMKESLKGGSAFGMKDVMSTLEMRKVKKQLCSKYGVRFSDLSSNNLTKTNLSGEFLGYMEGTIVDGKLVFTDIMIRAGGSFTFTYTYQMAVGFVGVEAGGSASIGLQWSRQFADTNQPLDFDIVFSVEPSLKAFAGLGIKGVASFDVYGKGTMPTSVEFTEKVFSIALKGEIGYEAKFLFWSTGEKPLLSGTLGPKKIYFGSGGKQSAPRAEPSRNGAPAEEPELTMIDRATDASVWLGDTTVPKKAPKKTPLAGVSEKTLQTGVYSGANPSIASCGSATVAVWTQDDPARDDYNRLCAVYSVYDSAADTWTAPRAIYDNGCNSYTPTVSSDGEHIYVAWQQANRTLTEPDCGDYKALLNATEIYSAVYDAADGTFTGVSRLTDNDVYDYSPAIGFAGGAPVWYYARSAEPEFNTASGNSLHKVSGGTDRIIADNSATICDLTVGGGQIAYIADTDGDLGTSGDRTVFYGADTVAAFPKAADNAPAVCSVFGDVNGAATLFVSDGENIYYLDQGELTAVLETPASVGRLRAVETGVGLELLWSGATEQGSELYTCSLENGVWSDAVSLTGRGNLFSGFDAAEAGSHVMIFAAETVREYDEEKESYVSGATNLVAFRENDFCDMSVSGLFVNELGVKEGETSELTFTLENQGNTLFNSAALVLSDSCGTQETVTLECEILPGKSEPITIPYVIPAGFAGAEVTVSVLAAGDADPSDDSAAYKADSAQLTTIKDSITHIGDSYVLSCITTASGFTAAEDIQVTASFDAADGTPVDSVSAERIQKETGFVSEFAFLESELSFDENGVAVVYVTTEAASGESTTEAFTIEKDDTVCAHPITEMQSLASTCTEDGYENRIICLCCGDTVDAGTTIPATGHSFGAWKKLNDTQHQRICANDASHIEKANHTWNAGKVTKAATCTATGVKTYTCTACKATKTEMIVKLGHSFGAWTKLDAAYHQRVCANDATHIEKAAHTWDNGKVTTPAAVGKTGVKTYTCTVCKAAKTETIPALPTEPASEQPEPSSDPTVEPTRERPTKPLAPTGGDPTSEVPDATEPTATEVEPTRERPTKPLVPTGEDPTSEVPGTIEPTTTDVEPTGEIPTTEIPGPTDPTTTDVEPTGEVPTTEIPGLTDPTTTDVEPTGEVPTTEVPGPTDPTATDAEPTTAPKPGDEPGTTETPGETDPAQQDLDLISADDSSLAVDHENSTVRLQPNVKAEDFAALTKNEADDLRILTADGAPAEAGKPVGTGFVVQLLRGGEVVREYTVIVPLDCTGDGRVNSADARAALRSAARLEILKGVYFTAADADRNEKVAAADARMILRVAAKLEDYPGM